MIKELKKVVMIIMPILVVNVMPTMASASEMSCFISDTGKLSKFGMFCGDGEGGSTFIHLRRKDAGAMVEFKDTSLRNPWGGRHSVPNTMHRQFIKKPLKFLKKLF